MTILFHGHLPYFIEILEYVAIGEIFKKFLLPSFEQTQQLDGNLSLSENKERKLEDDSVPIVYSDMGFKMCQSLDIKTRLAPEEERSAWIAKFKKRSKSKPTIPEVNYKIIYQLCNALDTKVMLSPTIEPDAITQKPNRRRINLILLFVRLWFTRHVTP
ncbi:hypothetical protein TNCV_1407371 [Trichonephila clavipes]|nr:hypothetical protein TNCV_1407371 [Trichonephila clavipes]